MIVSPLWTPENVAQMTTLWSAGKSASFIATLLGCSRNACIGKIHRLGLNRAPRVANAPPPWDPKDVQKLRTLFASEAKFTFAEMAAVLGMSKGAVSGELSRLGLRRTAGTARAMPVRAKPRPKRPAAVSETHKPIAAHSASSACSTPLAGSGGENEPAPISVAIAKGSVGKAAPAESASMPDGDRALVGFRVGVPEGAHRPAGAGDTKCVLRADGISPRGPVTIAELEDYHCRWPVTMVAEPMRYCGTAKVLGSSYCAAHAELGGGVGTVAERKALRELRKASGLTGIYT